MKSPNKPLSAVAFLALACAVGAPLEPESPAAFLVVSARAQGVGGGSRSCEVGLRFESGPVMNGHNRQPTPAEFEARKRVQEERAVRAPCVVLEKGPSEKASDVADDNTSITNTGTPGTPGFGASVAKGVSDPDVIVVKGLANALRHNIGTHGHAVDSAVAKGTPGTPGFGASVSAAARSKSRKARISVLGSMASSRARGPAGVVSAVATGRTGMPGFGARISAAHRGSAGTGVASVTDGSSGQGSNGAGGNGGGNGGRGGDGGGPGNGGGGGAGGGGGGGNKK